MQSPDDEPHAESPSENGPLSAEESIDSFMEEELDSQNSSSPASEILSVDEDASNDNQAGAGPSDQEIFEDAIEELFGDDEDAKDRIRNEMCPNGNGEEE